MKPRRGAPSPDHVLIAGVSTRAAAESAARAGFHVTAIDAFADLDHHPRVRARSVDRFSPAAAVTAARDVRCDAVVYLANFENDPSSVRRLATGRALWGNSPDVLVRARDPVAVAEALGRNGHPALDVSVGPRPGNQAARDNRRWLAKPLKSGGGHGIRPWPGHAPPPRGCFLQERVDGTPGSVVFVAAGGRAVPLGVSRQLIGEPAFGVAGYRYCGSVLAAARAAAFGDDTSVVDAACAVARTAAAEFGLVGVNGIDFVARNGIPWVVEINPRWCASMELVELAYGLSMFDLHVSACAAGTLPDFDLATARRAGVVLGKAVVFARHAVTIGNTREWLSQSQDHAHARFRDIPHPGERISAGRPVCTVYATGRDASACQGELTEHAARVYAQLAAWERTSSVL